MMTVHGVCLSVREHIRKTSRPIFAIFTRVSHARGSVLLWWRCEAYACVASSEAHKHIGTGLQYRQVCIQQPT